MLYTCTHIIDSPKDTVGYMTSGNPDKVLYWDEWDKAYLNNDTAMLKCIEQQLEEFSDIKIEDIGGTFVAVQYRSWFDYAPDFTGTPEEVNRTLWYVK